ncbi:MAG: hypothetical protein LiPW41_665 [Parcubacteria group bacterium LiPW_41]|nr:MAG: hypothetical protein LiPW41_665 [Parcubacteria group bacterium LiPW_41]
MERKYYFYDVNANFQETLSSDVRLISEVSLPKFSTAEKHIGRCSFLTKNIPQNTPLNKTICVAFGDPRIFKCKILSFSLIEMPKEVEDFFTDMRNTYNMNIINDGITLEFNGGKIWTLQSRICLEKDLT